MSASVSILKLSANPSSTGLRLTNLNWWDAPEDDPIIVSPTLKSPVTAYTSRRFNVEFHDFTLPVVPLLDPVTISLNVKSPVEVKEGFPTTIVGATL